MTATKTAQYTIICGLFILVLLLTSSFDLAITVLVSSYFLFTYKNYIALFILSLIVLLVDILFKNYDITVRLISDLLLDAYILFLTALYLYLKSNRDFKKILDGLKAKDKKILSKTMLFKLSIGLGLTLLFFPIMGGYVAAILGYSVYSQLTRQFNGRIAIIVSLGMLVTTAFFLIIKKNAIAEMLANYVYLFLVIGTIQEVINLIRHKDIDLFHPPDEIKYLGPRKTARAFPNIELSRTYIGVLLIVVILLVSSILIYYLYPKSSKTAISQPTPLPSSLPSITPTPTEKVATVSSQLKVMILNGTNVPGLAASTSAKLKDAGFQNIQIGNTGINSYPTWEVLLKNHNQDIIDKLIKVLELKTMTVKEATAGAKFDIEIVVGEKK